MSPIHHVTGRDLRHSSFAERPDKSYQQAPNGAPAQINTALFRSITIQEKHITDYEPAQPSRSLPGDRFLESSTQVSKCGAEGI